MVVPLWDDPHRYADNSPIAYMNRVKTPVLYFGAARQPFMVFERLERPAVNVAGTQDDQEREQRIDRWLREHLFGEPATIQKADVPAQFLR